MVDYEVFDLGDGRLQMGATLRDAKLAYKTYGELNQDRSNGDIGKTPGFDGDVERALGAITARAIVMPAVGDDVNQTNTEFIDDALKGLLAQEA